MIPLLNGDCDLHLENGEIEHQYGRWDMIIAHPPCTDLAASGARHFEKKRADGRQLTAIKFFKAFLEADCDKIAVENPVNIIGSNYIKQWFPEYSNIPNCSQIIQPYEYGDPYRKITCLWLKGLPELKPTNIVEPKLKTYISKTGHKTTFSEDYGICKAGKERSKTYPGIAKAMAEQWT